MPLQKNIAVVVLLLAVIFSCNTKQNYPSNFNFSLSYGYFGEKISTFDSTFTLKYSTGDSVFSIHFTAEEKQKIYESLIKNDYYNLPDHFTCRDNMRINPSQSYELKVQTNDTVKSVFSQGGCLVNEEKEIQKFNIIVKQIIEELTSKKEYQEVPKTDLIAL